MRVYGTLMATAVTGFAILCISIGTASAGRLSLSSQTFRATWNALLFHDRFCAVTLEGRFHSRTFAKVAGALIGNVTTMAVPAMGCAEVRILEATLPWHIRYVNFSGTLPTITTIRADVIGAAILLSGFDPFRMPYGCLYRSTVAEPMRLIFNRAASGVLTSVRPDETLEINRERLLRGFCPPGVHLEGASTTLTVLNAATAITMTLI